MMRIRLGLGGKDGETMIIILIDYSEPCHTIITNIDAWYASLQALERAQQEAVRHAISTMTGSIIIVKNYEPPNLG